MRDCMKYPIFDIDGPYAKAPWDGEKDLNSLSLEQLNLMTEEQIEEWLTDGKKD